MNKPLRDWTLGEMQEYCKGSKNCIKCEMLKNACDCRVESVPSDWDLSEHHRWTAEDIADAKAVKRLFPDVVIVERYKDGELMMAGGGISDWFRGGKVFLSLKEGECVNLQEILDSEAET